MSRATWWIAPLAGALVLAAAAAALNSYGDRHHAAGFTAGQKDVQARWDKETTRLQALALEEQDKARLERLRRQAAEQKAADEQTQREAELRTAADRSRRAVSLVQQQLDAVIRAAAAGGTAGSSQAPAGGRSAVETLGGVLGQCVARYRELAESAQRDRSAGLRCEQEFDALTSAGGAPVQ